jgi:hypothetical protein
MGTGFTIRVWAMIRATENSISNGKLKCTTPMVRFKNFGSKPLYFK